jgi:hypothetical protein
MATQMHFAKHRRVPCSHACSPSTFSSLPEQRHEHQRSRGAYRAAHLSLRSPHLGFLRSPLIGASSIHASNTRRWSVPLACQDKTEGTRHKRECVINESCDACNHQHRSRRGSPPFSPGSICYVRAIGSPDPLSWGSAQDHLNTRSRQFSEPALLANALAIR